MWREGGLPDTCVHIRRLNARAYTSTCTGTSIYILNNHMQSKSCSHGISVQRFDLVLSAKNQRSTEQHPVDRKKKVIECNYNG